MPVGFPATKSGVEINLLKTIFTPEEAQITTHLGYKHKTVDQVFQAAKGEVGSKEELIRILDEVVSKGGISRRERHGQKKYIPARDQRDLCALAPLAGQFVFQQRVDFE